MCSPVATLRARMEKLGEETRASRMAFDHSVSSGFRSPLVFFGRDNKQQELTSLQKSQARSHSSTTTALAAPRLRADASFCSTRRTFFPQFVALLEQSTIPARRNACSTADSPGVSHAGRPPRRASRRFRVQALNVLVMEREQPEQDILEYVVRSTRNRLRTRGSHSQTGRRGPSLHQESRPWRSP